MVRQVVTDSRSDALLRPDFAKLEELAQLPRGWDSYGAEPIGSAALELAESLLIAAATGCESRADDRVRPYVIVPVADGGVQLEWRGSNGLIEVEIGPDASISYLLLRDGQVVAERSGVAMSDVRRALIDLLCG